jgi:hypothetical protein
MFNFNYKFVYIETNEIHTYFLNFGYKIKIIKKIVDINNILKRLGLVIVSCLKIFIEIHTLSVALT